MKTEADAFALAEEMVEVGNAAGKKTAAVITDMDQPLGEAVGNALEVKEAIAALKGEFGGDLLELCMVLGSNILMLSGKADDEASARAMLQKTIDDGSALRKLADFVAAQGGDVRCIYDPSLLPTAPVQLEVRAEDNSYVNHMNAEGIGLVSLHLGGGRTSKDSPIDPAVGVIVKKKTGDYAAAGDVLAVLHAADGETARAAEAELRACYVFSGVKPEPSPFLKGMVR